MSNSFEKLECPTKRECNKLAYYPCMNCSLPTNCRYGEELNVTCNFRPEVECMVSIISNANFHLPFYFV